MRPYRVYRVQGNRDYMGCEPGEEFIARLDKLKESRALQRGAILIVDEINPSIEPERLTLPQSWLRPQPAPVNQDRPRAVFS